MPKVWNDAVKQTHRLKVYPEASVQKGSWAAVFDACLKEFNHLSKINNLGVTLERSKTPLVKGGGGADVQVTSANGQVDLDYENEQRSLQFIGTRLHGHTWQVSRGGPIEKAFVILPSQPMISTPKGLRPVGHAVMKLIAVHEFVHACGLTDGDHTDDDLFQAYPNVDSGNTGAQDRAKGKRGQKEIWMPPIFLSSSTAQLIRDIWS